MISFHKPKFHEKILKKYGRKIRKANFPNLFFMQKGKSSGSVKRHISVRINLNFHNTLFQRNFPLSSPKEKQQGNLLIPFKLSYPDLKKPDLTHEKPASFNLGSGSLEPVNLTPQLINPELISHNLTLLKLVNPKLTTHNLTLLKLISPELTTHNLTIHKFINPESTTRNLTIHKLINPESTTHNPAPANPTYTNLTSLKLTFSGKKSREPRSEKGNKIRNPWSCNNFFSSGNSSFFIYSNPPSVPEINSQKTHHATDSHAQSLLTVLVESGLSRKIHNEALRKLDELNLSGLDFLFSKAILSERLSSGTTDLRVSAGSGEPFSRHFPPEYLNRILSARKMTGESSQIRKRTGLERQNIPEQSFRKAGFKELSLKTLEQEKPGKEKSAQNELKLEKLIREELSQNKLSDRTIQVRTNRTEAQKEVNRQLILEKQDIREIREKQDIKEIREKQDIKEIREKQDIREIREKQDIREIREKQDIREIREKQDIRELIDYGDIPKTSFSNPVQFLIRNFLEKTSFFLNREYSTDTESSFISPNNMPEQKTGVFPFSKKGIRQILPTGGISSAKGAVTKKTIPERFSKNLFILRKSLLYEDTPGIPGISTRISSRLLTFIRSPQLISKNGITEIGLSRQGPTGTPQDHKSPARYKGPSKIFLKYSSSISRQYPPTGTEIRAGVLEKIFINSIEKQTRNQQSALELNSFFKQGSESPGLKVARAFNWLTAFTYNIAAASQLNQEAIRIPGIKAAFKLNQQVTRTKGSKAAFQPDRQEAHKSRNIVFASHNQPAIKAANRALIHVLNSLVNLLASNKSTYTTATYTTNSPADIARDRKYPSRHASHQHAWLQNIFKLKPVPIPSSTAMLEGRDTSYFPKMPVLLAYNSTATYTTEQPVVQAPAGIKARIFNNPMTLKPNLTKGCTINYSTVNATSIKEAYAHMYPTARVLDYAKTCTFSYSLIRPAVRKPASKVTRETDNLTADNQRGLKREQHYPVWITRLQATLNKLTFLKPLTTTVYTLKHPETPLPGSKENYTSSETATPKSGRKETHTFNPPGNYRTLYTPSGMDIPAAPSYFITLRKPHNPVQADRLSSSKLSSDKTFNSSVPLISRKTHTTSGQKAVSGSLWRNKSIDSYPGIRKLQQISSGCILSARLKSVVETVRKGLLSAPVPFSYTLIPHAVQKPSSKVTRETAYLTADNQANNYPTADNYTADNQRGLKREKQYPVRIKRLHAKLKQPAFLRPLTTNVYTLKHSEPPLPGSTENFTSNETATQTSGRKETHTFHPPGKHTHHITSIYTFMHPVARAFNYVETNTHSYPASMAFNYTANYPFNYSAARKHDLKAGTINYPTIYNNTQRTARHPPTLLNNYYSEKWTGTELPGLSLSFPRMRTSTPLPDTGFLERSRNLYPPSGTDTTAAPSYFITLIKPHNPVQAGRLSSSRLSSSGISPNRISSDMFSSNKISSGKPFNSSVPLLSGKDHKPVGQKAIRGSLWRNKSMDVYPGIRKLQQISSALILSPMPKNIEETVRTGLLSTPTPQKISAGKGGISTGLLFRFKGIPGPGKTAKSHPYPVPGSTNLMFSRGGGEGKNPGTAGFGASGKEKSELMHAGRSIHKTGRQELVYGKPETLQEEVEQIKKIAFETKAAVADHFESHLPQAEGKTGQVADVEHMSEKIMQMIERRLKIEVERRGIF